MLAELSSYDPDTNFFSQEPMFVEFSEENNLKHKEN